MRSCPRCGTRFEHEQFCPHDGTPTQEVAPEPVARPVDPLLGRVLEGRYRLDKAIGEGGMGVVYQATHTALGKKCAVKVLRGDMARDTDIIHRFIQEARAASEIGHENIVDITDFGKLPDGSAYFVMEHLVGEPLTAFIKRGGAVPVQDALQMIRQMASALGAAHARGIVHRDLKPDNIFLVKRGGTGHFVKVLDFGIAKVGGAASKLTRTGQIFGTPHYMSPEQAAGQAVDQRTDIYALGVIMYELFTGRVPFDADTFMGILTKHMFEPPVRPSETGNTRLGALEDVVMKALAKKPEQRYQTMDELLQDLDRVESGGQIVIGGGAPIRPPTNLADALEPPSRTEMKLRASRPQIAKSRAPLLILAAAGAFIVLGAVIGVIIALTSGGEVRASPVAPARPIALPPPTQPTPTAPAGAETIEIRTEPLGALVYVGEDFVGQTPFPFAPNGVERTLQFRMRGFVTKTARVRPGMGPFSVPLEPEAAQTTTASTNASRVRKTRVTRPSQSSAPLIPASQQRSTTRISPQSELADPWASPRTP